MTSTLLHSLKSILCLILCFSLGSTAIHGWDSPAPLRAFRNLAVGNARPKRKGIGMQKCADGRVGSRSQVPVRADAAVGPLFNHADSQRAIDALDLVFQDEEMPPGDLRLRQSRLLARLHERGISHRLGLALIEDLLTRGVFHAGKAFYNLKVFVRLDGQQADRATADRY